VLLSPPARTATSPSRDVDRLAKASIGNACVRFKERAEPDDENVQVVWEEVGWHPTRCWRSAGERSEAASSSAIASQ
jgi:hypothetical protein